MTRIRPDYAALRSKERKAIPCSRCAHQLADHAAEDNGCAECMCPAFVLAPPPVTSAPPLRTSTASPGYGYAILLALLGLAGIFAAVLR